MSDLANGMPDPANGMPDLANGMPDLANGMPDLANGMPDLLRCTNARGAGCPIVVLPARAVGQRGVALPAVVGCLVVVPPAAVPPATDHRVAATAPQFVDPELAATPPNFPFFGDGRNFVNTGCVLRL